MTEPKRHPHADVLIAIAEGREVQCRRTLDYPWKDTRDNPLSQPDWHWRVKPPKLKRWVNITEYGGGVWLSREAADSVSTENRIACIEIEFEEGDGL